ncbi:MAG: dimethyl sulfoxide reductase anchor subunit [Rhodospirillaceae bacterium]|nr:dimethyl sulfoxide reductase anchor subunit [Rhodospirillaceae bacterium]MCY4237225.1 dimethyl sulfoxide reductase anchor subunit [Rhodospirillaceae bacterium]
MHPAKSVIFFTTASGAGYGLILWLGTLSAWRLLPADQGFGLAVFAVALALIVVGLLSSTLHLGHPERAWRALSQWRSSWLSREGVAAILAFVPIGLFGIWWVFLAQNTGVALVFGIVAALAAMITVYCTAMIYASLKTIPAWSNGWTILSYLGLCAMTGALLLHLAVSLWGWQVQQSTGIVALTTTAVSLLVKLRYWSTISKPKKDSNAGTATGLGQMGTVRLLESPHSSDNYLMKEMGFRIAREHAHKLRTIAIVTGFMIPAAALAIGLTVGATPLMAIIAVLAACPGVVIERWLFFAEARHVVMLYYGAEAV